MAEPIDALMADHGYMRQAQASLEELFEERQGKYGADNIAAFGELGCLVRASDKIARLKVSMDKDFKDESAEDAWMDLANYAIIALMCRRGLWPGVEASG